MESFVLLGSVSKYPIEVGLDSVNVSAFPAVTGGLRGPEGVLHHLQFALITQSAFHPELEQSIRVSVEEI